MKNISNVMNLFSIKPPTEEISKFLKNCSESARLREILIDSHFNQILVDLLTNHIAGKSIGVFLSQTLLSIKETQTFSPNGVSIKRLESLDLNASFLTKFITAGFKVTDLGNIVRLANDEVSILIIPQPLTSAFRSLKT